MSDNSVIVLGDGSRVPRLAELQALLTAQVDECATLRMRLALAERADMVRWRRLQKRHDRKRNRPRAGERTGAATTEESRARGRAAQRDADTSPDEGIQQ